MIQLARHSRPPGDKAVSKELEIMNGRNEGTLNLLLLAGRITRCILGVRCSKKPMPNLNRQGMPQKGWENSRDMLTWDAANSSKIFAQNFKELEA